MFRHVRVRASGRGSPSVRACVRRPRRRQVEASAADQRHRAGPARGDAKPHAGGRPHADDVGRAVPRFRSRASIAVVVEAPGGDLPLALAGRGEPGRRHQGGGTRHAGRETGGGNVTAEFRARPSPRLALNHVQPGWHELRVAAVDRAGASDSVHFDLDVPDFSKGRIAMSGLLLPSADGAARADERHRSRLEDGAAGSADSGPRVLRGGSDIALHRDLRERREGGRADRSHDVDSPRLRRIGVHPA